MAEETTTISNNDPLTNTLKPLNDSFLTVRVIKSFTFRTTKNLLLPHLDLEAVTVGELKQLVSHQIKTASGFKPYRTATLDTLKLYTKAHGSKTTNLIINFENEDWILTDDSLSLAAVGMENESEVSFFNRADYEAFKLDPTTNW